MTPLSDDAVDRLRGQLARPALPARYRADVVIGRGGMGVVWRAHDAVLDREVAVKVLAEHVDGAEFTARLEREARILARLEHPGIVAVHDAGVLDDGRAWYVMRLVRGEALDRAAPRLGSVGDVVRTVVRVAEAVAHAHTLGVVHRDLKPGNVMLGPFGEVLVLDWGVARLAAESDGRRAPPGADLADDGGSDALTDHGRVLGTPGYMAPEQAAGLAADERSDIHGLGAILRDLLSAGGRRVPRALAAIRDRALAADPADRYADVEAFRRDLLRFQDGEPVAAHRERWWETLGRLWRKYTFLILLVLAYLLMRATILWWRGV